MELYICSYIETISLVLCGMIASYAVKQKVANPFSMRVSQMFNSRHCVYLCGWDCLSVCAVCAICACYRHMISSYLIICGIRFIFHHHIPYIGCGPLFIYCCMLGGISIRTDVPVTPPRSFCVSFLLLLLLWKQAVTSKPSLMVSFGFVNQQNPLRWLSCFQTILTSLFSNMLNPYSKYIHSSST